MRISVRRGELAMKRPLFLIPLAALLIASPIACRRHSPMDASKFNVEVIDGVRTIHNHAAQVEDASAVRLDFVGKIGELKNAEEKNLLYDPVDAARLSNGDILVLERNGCSVKRFNRDHEFVSSFGRKGQGPGDFQFPFSLRLNPSKNRLYVADYKISSFLLNGKYEGGFKPQKISGGMGGGSINELYRTSGLAVLSGSRVILPSPTSMGTDSGEHKLLSVYDEKGAPIRSFGAVKRFDAPELTLNANVAYFTCDEDDNVYVAYAFQNRIDKYSPDGKTIFSADRPLPYPVRIEMKTIVMKSGALEREFPWPSVTSVTKGIYIGPKNRVWVLTLLRQPNKFGGFDDEKDFSRCYEFEVFDAQGVFLFKVPIPNVGFDNVSLSDDRIFFIDSRTEACVYEYRIAEKP